MSNDLATNAITHPPLHTDPVYPNTAALSSTPVVNHTATTHSTSERPTRHQSQSTAAKANGSHAAGPTATPTRASAAAKDEPVNLAAMDVDESASGDSVDTGAGAQSRKITLKFKTGGLTGAAH